METIDHKPKLSLLYSAPKAIIEPFFFLSKTNKIVDLTSDHAKLSRGFFVEILAPLLRKIRFDPDYYRRAYPDLAEAEARGIISNLHEHYLSYGYFEDRLPCLIEVDGAFYAREYPDVAIAILESRVASTQVHFELAGFREGRLPARGWSFADLLNG